MTLPDGAPPEAVQPGDADMKEAGMPLDLEMDLWNSFTARVSGAATSFTGGEQSTAPSSEQHPDSPEPKHRKRDGKGGEKPKDRDREGAQYNRQGYGGQGRQDGRRRAEEAWYDSRWSSARREDPHSRIIEQICQAIGLIQRLCLRREDAIIIYGAQLAATYSSFVQEFLLLSSRDWSTPRRSGIDYAPRAK